MCLISHYLFISMFWTKQKLLEIKEVWEYVKVVNYILNRKLLRDEKSPQAP